MESLDLSHDEHEKLIFDCMNHRSMRLEELRLAANVAADRVRETGRPYRSELCLRASDASFTSRCAISRICVPKAKAWVPERRVVVFPKDYKGAAPSRPSFRRR